MSTKAQAPAYRSEVKRFTYSFLEAAWASALRMLRPLFAPGSTPVQPGPHDRVLALATHPDDEAAGCGGTLLAYMEAEGAVQIAFITDGRKSQAFGFGEAQMAQARRAEAEACSRILSNRSPVWMGLPEGGWRVDDLQEKLAELFLGENPSILYAPSLVDFHPEHLRVANAVALALAGLEPEHRPRLIRVYPAQVPLTPLLANRFLIIDEQSRDLGRVLTCYATQVGSLHAAWRMRRYAAVLHRQPGLVEEFLELTTAEYTGLHSGIIQKAPRVSTFRGLRPNPLSDPLAYSTGRLARHRLKRQLSGNHQPG